MDKKTEGKNNIKEITIKKNNKEEALKKDNTTEALVKAIRTILNKDNK